MQKTSTIKIEKRTHTRAQALIFNLKAFLLQLKRGAENLLNSEVKRFQRAEELTNQPAIAESKTPLWTESAPAEQFLLAGKVHNLRLAVQRLNGLEIPAGSTFSFWKHLGRANALKGYVVGRELREGCIVPNVGGGLEKTEGIKTIEIGDARILREEIETFLRKTSKSVVRAVA